VACRATILAAALVLFASPLGRAAADDKAADLLVGKWVPASGKEKDIFVEFTKDGMMTYTFGTKDGMTHKGKYTIIDDKTIEVEWTEDTLKLDKFLPKKPTKVKFSVSKDELQFDPALHNLKKTWKRAP
jgi:uncharacterized protein (TIGR03066 family)